jgi:hypothetical protein
MYLDIHDKINVSKKAKIFYNLEWRCTLEQYKSIKYVRV